MRQEVFERIIELIDDCSSWIRVHRQVSMKKVMVQSAGELVARPCRVLTLIAMRDRTVYRKGHVWDIPEHKLDQALRAVRRKGEVPKDGKLSAKNVESIIHKATNGFLNLNMYSL